MAVTETQKKGVITIELDSPTIKLKVRAAGFDTVARGVLYEALASFVHNCEAVINQMEALRQEGKVFAGAPLETN